jgi:riboflavin kinase/FMN adenylyltransferase
MRILTYPDCISADEKTVVSVGNFDGIHKGHVLLLKEVVNRAKEKSFKSAIVTFDPHTRTVLYPELTHNLLTTFDEKTDLLKAFGVDYLYKIPFNDGFRQMPPDDFVDKVLVNRLNISDWVMGEGHSVGKERAGGKKFLRGAVGKYHINMFTADLLSRSETIVSSTEIRKSISDGRIADAIEMLGHPYLISAERTTGLKIGSQIGYPTLNFKRPPSQKVIPPPGVYAAELEFDGHIQPGALYFGDCPTFEHRDVHFEFHSLKLSGQEPEAGQRAQLWVHKYIRKDEKFINPDELVKTIKKDINDILHFFQEEIRPWR